MTPPTPLLLSPSGEPESHCSALGELSEELRALFESASPKKARASVSSHAGLLRSETFRQRPEARDGAWISFSGRAPAGPVREALTRWASERLVVFGLCELPSGPCDDAQVEIDGLHALALAKERLALEAAAAPARANAKRRSL